MKLKMQVTAVSGDVEITTVELPRLDMKVAVRKAALAVGLTMTEVREVRLVTK